MLLQGLDRPCDRQVQRKSPCEQRIAAMRDLYTQLHLPRKVCAGALGAWGVYELSSVHQFVRHETALMKHRRAFTATLEREKECLRLIPLHNPQFKELNG